MRIAIVAHQTSLTNRSLAETSWGQGPASLLSPVEADLVLRSGDAALARLDVLQSLDGIEPGLLELECLAARVSGC